MCYGYESYEMNNTSSVVKKWLEIGSGSVPEKERKEERKEERRDATLLQD